MNLFPFIFLFIISSFAWCTASTLVEVKLKKGGSMQALLKGYKSDGSIILISNNDQEIHIKSGLWTGIQAITIPQETKILIPNQKQLVQEQQVKKVEIKAIPQWRKDLDLKLGGRFNGRKGRENTKEVSFITDADYKTKEGTHIEFDFRAHLMQRDKEVARRSWNVNIDYEKSYLSTFLGWYTNIDYESHDFQNLKNQDLYELGFFFNLLDRKNIQTHSLSFRAGAITKQIEYINSVQGSESDKGYSTGYKYYYNINKKVKMESKASLEVFDDQEDLNRLFSEHSIEFPLAFLDKISLKLGLEYNYILEPKLDAEHLDLRYYNNILWKF